MLALLCACTAENPGLDADVIDGGSPDDAGFVDAQASCEPVDAGFDGTEALCPGNNLRETSGAPCCSAVHCRSRELYYCPDRPPYQQYGCVCEGRSWLCFPTEGPAWTCRDAG